MGLRGADGWGRKVELLGRWRGASELVGWVSGQPPWQVETHKHSLLFCRALGVQGFLVGEGAQSQSPSAPLLPEYSMVGRMPLEGHSAFLGCICNF